MNKLEGVNELVGSWTFIDGKMAEDETSRFIEDLTQNQLEKLVVSSDGWATLYVDPHNQRLWELTFPKAEMHGAGPKALRVLNLADAKQKYDLPDC